MKNYQNMTNEEIKEQLEWSDQHEFSYGYAMWAFKEIERLNNIIDEALGIANERVNYYCNHKTNNEEHIEDWEEIFDVLVKRDGDKE